MTTVPVKAGEKRTGNPQNENYATGEYRFREKARQTEKEAFSAENVLKILLRQKLISQLQAKDIVKRKDFLKAQLEKRKKAFTSGERLKTSVSIVDVISSLNLKRMDGSQDNLDEEVIYRALSKEWGIEYRTIDPLKLDLNLVTTTIPRSFAMKHLILPVSINNGELTIATSNPFNPEILDDIERVTHMRVIPVVSAKSEIIKIINEFFGFKQSIAQAELMFGGPAVDLGNLEQYVRMGAADELRYTDQHIVTAVNHLFTYAFDQRASDIHIEPKRDVCIVRLRIDGVLHTVYKLPKNVHSAIVSRIKGLSRLDMAEKRRPQDGRVKTNKGEQEVEIRVSTIPVAFGEKVVMRIMDPDILFQDLENLGFSGQDLMRYNQCIRMPHGILLVCGPTGSGKSTTLYSTLRELSTPEINITTVEDPIEMIHEDFNQIAVQPAINVTFSSILRNILRQDPDIIMIGEMRDLETAQNAVQAALTGHLVLSTLHTNDAPSSITRLIDLGVQSFLIQSTLVGILGQRLVRRICKRCISPFVIETDELRARGLDIPKKGKLRLFQGKGCEKCRRTGYFGRTGIFEVLPYSEQIKKHTSSLVELETIRNIARKEGMVSMRDNAIKKLLAGETTYQEVLRVTWEQ